MLSFSIERLLERLLCSLASQGLGLVCCSYRRSGPKSRSRRQKTTVQGHPGTEKMSRLEERREQCPEGMNCLPISLQRWTRHHKPIPRLLQLSYCRCGAASRPGHRSQRSNHASTHLESPYPGAAPSGTAGLAVASFRLSNLAVQI